MLNLPTRPTKRSDTRAKNWEGGSVEDDAIPAQTLRTMLEEFIALRVDRHQLAVLEVAEADERRILERLAGVAS